MLFFSLRTKRGAVHAGQLLPSVAYFRCITELEFFLFGSAFLLSSPLPLYANHGDSCGCQKYRCDECPQGYIAGLGILRYGRKLARRVSGTVIAMPARGFLGKLGVVYCPFQLVYAYLLVTLRREGQHLIGQLVAIRGLCLLGVCELCIRVPLKPIIRGAAS